MNAITVPVAIITSASITVLMAVVSALITKFYKSPSIKRKIRGFIFSEIQEMIYITKLFDLSDSMRKLREEEWKFLPLIVDKNLPTEKFYDLFLNNIELFSEREGELIGRIHRRIKLNRSIIISLSNAENYNKEQIRILSVAAEETWEKIISTAEQMEKELHVYKKT